MNLSGWRKYLLVAALLILGCFCMFFNYAFESSENRIIREQALEKEQDLGLLCGIIDQLVEMDKATGLNHGYADVLQYAVAFIEKNYYSTFAQVFDENLHPLTELSPGVGGGKKHNPMDYKEFVDAVTSDDPAISEHGKLTYWYETPEAGGRTVHIAYRWVPTDKEHVSRYLVVIGISKYTIVEQVDPLVKYGAVALVIIAGGIILAAVLVLCQLGHIYDFRIGEKWRKKEV